MPDLALRITGLSKRYELGPSGSRQGTLTEALAELARRPWRAFARRPRRIVWALRDVGFDVERGAVVGLIGRNGSGKTTLLKILSGITDPTAGKAEIRGRVGSLLEVGTGFHPELTGRENVFLNGAILGMNRQEITRRFDEIVAFAEIESFLDMPVKRYSSGMQVRLAFAVAAHIRPEILLIDEVLSVGDIAFQKKCMGRMESVVREGSTVLIVSYHMGTVRSLCSKAVLLEAGMVKAAGDTDRVVSEYLRTNRTEGSEIAITDEDHVGGVRKLRVERIRLIDGVEGSFAVYWKQPIRIQLDIDVLHPLENVAFGAGIRMIDGTHVFHVHHDDEGTRPLWTFDVGCYTLDFVLENPLRPGFYKLHVGADQDHLMSHNVCGLNAVTIEVLEHSAQGAVPLASNTGFMNGHSVWSRPVRRDDSVVRAHGTSG